MGKKRVDLIKMLKELFEGQGFNVDEDDAFLSISDDDGSFGGALIFVKNKAEKFLMDIYNLGHDAGYSKGLKDMRHIQAKIKEQENEKREGDRTRIRVLPRSTDKAGEKRCNVQARNPGI